MEWVTFGRVSVPAFFEEDANKRLTLKKATTINGYSVPLSNTGGTCQPFRGHFPKLEVFQLTGDATAGVRQRWGCGIRITHLD